MKVRRFNLGLEKCIVHTHELLKCELMTQIVEWTECRPLPKSQQSELVASSWDHSCALSVKLIAQEILAGL